MSNLTYEDMLQSYSEINTIAAQPSSVSSEPTEPTEPSVSPEPSSFPERKINLLKWVQVQNCKPVWLDCCWQDGFDSELQYLLAHTGLSSAQQRTQEHYSILFASLIYNDDVFITFPKNSPQHRQYGISTATSSKFVKALVDQNSPWTKKQPKPTVYKRTTLFNDLTSHIQ